MASGARLVLVLLVLASSAIDAVYGYGIEVVNSCGYPVTTCAQNENNPISQYNLGAGASQFLDFGRACRWPAGAVWASVRGQCIAPGGPSNAAYDRNLANLAEFTIGGGTDTYDLSNVNAYTIGLSISGGSCHAPKCVISDIRGLCHGDNQLVSLPTGALSCINTDGPNVASPTVNTQMFKTRCEDSFSYTTDNPTSQFTCGTGTNYQVTFCPGNLLSDK